MGWALIRGWVFINFSYLQDGRLFGVGAYSGWALIRGWALNQINTVLYVIIIFEGTSSSKKMDSALTKKHVCIILEARCGPVSVKYLLNIN